MFKRMMSLLLALVLTVGMLPPVEIHAEEAEEIPETVAVETAAPETEETETAAAETTVPAETEAATEAEETAPAETEPLQTEAEETEPEELEADGIVSSAATFDAYSGFCGASLTWELSEDGVLTISGTGSMEDYACEEQPWWEYAEEIRAVVLEAGVTSIGDYAFYASCNLTDVTIPDSVAAIGDWAFEACSSLPNVTIPSGVAIIGDYAFWECAALTGVTIPESVIKIGNAAFGGCSGLTSMTIPAGVAVIEGNPFERCENLLSIEVDDGNRNYCDMDGVLFNKAGTILISCPGGREGVYEIPVGTQSIGESAFWYCEKLTGVTIPEGVTRIGDFAFTSCAELTAVEIPMGVTRIGKETFANCYSLTSVTIPGSVTEIGDNAFCAAYSLTEITIPKSVTRIDDYAFINSQSLKRVYFEGDAPQLGEQVFEDTYSPLEIFYPRGNATWTEEVRQNYGAVEVIWTEYDPNPPEVEDSGTCGENLTWELSEDGVLTISGTGPMEDYEFADQPWWDCRLEITAIVLTEGVTSIGDRAFESCGSLTAVAIPGSVTGIGKDAFRDCKSLISVTIPGSVANIGDSAFMTCEAMTDVTIQDGVTGIGLGTFYYCSSLTSVTIPGSVADIGTSAFVSCTSLEKVYFTGDAPTFGNYIFYGILDTLEIFYPRGNASWTEEIRQNYGAADVIWTEYDPFPLPEITVEGPATVREGSSVQLNATFSAEPEAGTEIVWTLAEGDEAYVTLTPDGSSVTVTAALVEEPVTVTVTASAPGKAVEGSFTLTVEPLPEITVEGPVVVYSGGSVQLNAVFSCEPEAGTEVVWTLAEGDEAYVTLTPDGNSVTVTAARVEESVTVTVTASAPGKAAPCSFTLTVEPNVILTESMLIYQIYYSGGEEVRYNLKHDSDWYYWLEGGLENGFNILLDAEASPAEAEARITWSSSNPEIATIDPQTGRVRFSGKPGKTTLTATANDGSGVTSWVNFETRAVLAVSGDTKIDLLAGKAETLKIMNQKTGKAVPDKDILWTIDAGGEDPEAFVTLKAGKLTAKQVSARAQLQISASVNLNGEYQKPFLYDVTVYPAVTQLELYCGDETVNSKTLSYNLADSQPMVISAEMFPFDVMDLPVDWVISDKKEAFATYTVEGNAVTVQAKDNAKPGAVTIKATAADGSKKSATVKIQFASYATQVVITSTENQVRAGSSLQLNAHTVPEKPTKAGVVWTLKNASDKNYATVSATGKVQGKTVYGETPVTLVATSKDGMASAEYTVTVLPKDTGILILKQGNQNVTKTTLNVDQNTVSSIQLSAWNYGSGDQAEVQWKSSTPKAATVDGNGLVTVLGKGNATITATAADKRTATVILKIAPAASEVIAQEGAEVASGKSVKLTAQVVGVPKGQVTWSIVSGGQYGKISGSGSFTAAKDITSAKQVTVRATAKDGGIYDDTVVTVRPVSQGVQIFTVGTGVQTFSIDSNARWQVRSNTVLQWDMNSSTEIQLGARVYPFYQEGSAKNAIQTVKWVSSAKNVASIDENGLVTCLKPGTTTITATAADGSGKKVSFKLTVVKAITSLEMEDQTVVGGKSLTLTKLITINPSDATNKTLDWKIIDGNTAGVTLVKGVLKTPKVISARILTIRATATDGSGKSVEFRVTINPA